MELLPQDEELAQQGEVAAQLAPLMAALQETTAARDASQVPLADCLGCYSGLSHTTRPPHFLTCLLLMKHMYLPAVSFEVESELTFSFRASWQRTMGPTQLGDQRPSSYHPDSHMVSECHSDICMR